MDRCEDCYYAKYSKGACRGVMDCDPDEYWCAADHDDIFCADSIEELYEYYIEDYEDLEDFTERFDCPDFCYRRDDDGPDPDAWYDDMRCREIEDD